ncbi:MAG: glycosyltransferase family 4 protein [Clostridia bacterium]|nr:glycosyltransferase family 4 protein [Clostridia bacterium]
MKILIVTNHSFMLWQFRRELIGELLKEHEVVISVPFGDHIEDFKKLGCRMIDTELDRRGINPVKDLTLYRTYHRLLKTEKPDLVITYSIKPNIYAGFACRQLGIPYCVNVQGLGTAFQKPVLSDVVTVMYKTALKKAKAVFFENEGNAEEFRKRKITPASQQHVLPGAGVNLARFTYREYPQNDTVHFLYLGRIMKEKGVDELFWAARNLREEGEDFVLDLVGFFEDAYKEEVDALVKDGIAVFHGFQPDPVPFYAAADCVILPSYHEGMSNVLLEAAAVGRPVITSDIPGCREAVIDGMSGLLCQVQKREAVYDAMKKILTLTPDERRQMGLTGRRLMEDKFEKSKVVEQTKKAVLA